MSEDHMFPKAVIVSHKWWMNSENGLHHILQKHCDGKCKECQFLLSQVEGPP